METPKQFLLPWLLPTDLQFCYLRKHLDMCVGGISSSFIYIGMPQWRTWTAQPYPIHKICCYKLHPSTQSICSGWLSGQWSGIAPMCLVCRCCLVIYPHCQLNMRFCLTNCPIPWGFLDEFFDYGHGWRPILGRRNVVMIFTSDHGVLQPGIMCSADCFYKCATCCVLI